MVGLMVLDICLLYTVEDHYQDCSNNYPRVKIAPGPRSHLIFYRFIQTYIGEI